MKKLVKVVKMVKQVKQVKMIKLMIMRSALGYPELGSALDYRDTLFSLKPPRTRVRLRLLRYSGQPLYSTHVQGYSQQIICGIANIKNNIFVQIGHGQNNVHKCMSLHKWA